MEDYGIDQLLFALQSLTIYSNIFLGKSALLKGDSFRLIHILITEKHNL